MAMEHGPFEDVFPIKEWGYSIAMLVYQRVSDVAQSYSYLASFVDFWDSKFLENRLSEMCDMRRYTNF